MERRMLLSAGQIDTFFGTKGVVTTHIAGGTSQIDDVEVLTDGRILASGTYTTSSDSHLIFVRYLADGQPDPAFGGAAGAPTGVVISDLTASTGTIKLLSNGKFLFLDQTRLIRFNGDGSVDPTFTQSSFTHFKFIFLANGMDVQEDGKILIAGSYRHVAYGSRPRFAVARLKPNGERDPHFGWGGVADYWEVSNQYASAEAVRALADGSIVAVGSFVHDYANDMTENRVVDAVSAKLHSDGMLDTSYGTAGLATATGTYFSGALITGVIAPDGTSSLAANGDYLQFFRFTATGTRDTAFDGSFSTSLVTPSLAVPPDHTLIAAVNHGNTNSSPNGALLAWNAAGAKDTTFGTNGLADQNLGTGDVVLTAPIFANDGSILAAVHTGSDMKMARFWRDDAPAVEIKVRNLKKASPKPYSFQLLFRDDVAVDARTIGSGAIRIVAPDGTQIRPDMTRLVATQGQSLYTGDFQLAPPGGSWGPEDNGWYQIQLLGGRVSDKAGHFSTGRIIGSFIVRIPAAVTPAMQPASLAASAWTVRSSGSLCSRLLGSDSGDGITLLD